MLLSSVFPQPGILDANVPCPKLPAISGTTAKVLQKLRVTLCFHFVSTCIGLGQNRHARAPCQAQKNAVSAIYRSGHSTGCPFTPQG